MQDVKHAADHTSIERLTFLSEAFNKYFAPNHMNAIMKYEKKEKRQNYLKKLFS